MAKTTGGKIIARMLHAEGVEVLFGIIDGTYLHMFANCVELGMRMITPRHETTAAHMAGSYARLTGKLGVCIASNGPGVANVLPGVAVENGEGNRVLLLTSSRRTGITYPDRGGAYQYFDQVKTIGAMSKWSASAQTVERIPELLRQALRQCYLGRPGVVHLDIPENLINGEVEDTFEVQAPENYRRQAALEPAAEQVHQAVELLIEAKLPVIHAGSGIIHAGAYPELERLAELLHCPVTTSWSARGVLPETSAWAYPMVLMDLCNRVHNEADLVLVLGAVLGETDWWGKAPNWRKPSEQKMIQVDLNEEALGRNRPVDLAVLADVRVFLVKICDGLETLKSDIPRTGRIDSLSALATAREEARAELNEALKDTEAPMLTAHVAAECRKVFADDAVAVFDGGNTAVWGNTYHQVRTPNTQLGTWHFGHLGAGLGQALGAAAARPDKQVYCILGDGAMGFHPQEIETAVRNDMPIVFLVCADKQWGMVKLTELFALGPVCDQFPNALAEQPHINGDLGEIAWDDLARSMGAHGERVSDPAELAATIERCLAAKCCSVIHVEVDPAKHLMAPGLMHFKEMHQEPAGS
ncbi:MAG: thiamine pyrophosphate-binding protein [Deltaproteobacteria bacterium]|nr:thiamine pyrophosphate-binding protein [Deltaproteobacteria bacterium]MBW1871925.1 thiamine pyrophosphate-binding protein [Deltaproteobacteria bacterium]